MGKEDKASVLAARRRVGFKENLVGAACSQTDWCRIVLLLSDLEYVFGLSGCVWGGLFVVSQGDTGP